MPNIGGWGFRQYRPLHTAILGTAQHFTYLHHFFERLLAISDFLSLNMFGLLDTLCRPAYHNTDTNSLTSITRSS